MDSARILTAVTDAFDVLVAAGERHDGLFPSIVDRESGVLLEELPDPIPGQRNSDRAFRGSNLIHDHPTLRAMTALAEHDGRQTYEAAVDRYLRTFATECTDTKPGCSPGANTPSGTSTRANPRAGTSYRRRARRGTPSTSTSDSPRCGYGTA